MADNENVLKFDEMSKYDKKLKNYISSFLAYPVGYVYETVDADFNPNTADNPAFTGTWTQDFSGFCRAVKGGTPGTTGGESEHTLTVEEMPSHYHNFMKSTFSTNKAGSGYNTVLSSVTTSTGNTGGAGSGKAFSIIPTHIVVNRWIRTA